MSNADAAWLGMDAPDNLMMVTAVLRFSERLDPTRFADVVRLRMVERYPAFRRRVVVPARLFARPHWSDDDDFDLDHHIVPAELARP